MAFSYPNISVIKTPLDPNVFGLLTSHCSFNSKNVSGSKIYCEERYCHSRFEIAIVDGNDRIEQSILGHCKIDSSTT